MNPVDKIYLDCAENIRVNGFSEENVKNADVRPRWTDGEPAYTYYIPQVLISYPQGVTPLLSLRKIAWQAGIKEILWIYQDKNNDVNLLEEKYGVKYWDEWKNEEGNLGTAYGYQIGKTFTSPETGKPTNQIDRLIENLKNDPLNRRHLTTLIDVDDMADMTLVPCAFQTLWTVTDDKLNMTLVQRSGDFLAAAAPGGINAIQYYALLLMVAKVTGYKPGNFVHFVQNLHIYDRHVPIVEEVVSKFDSGKPAPKLILNGEFDSFYDISLDDFEVINYEPDETKYDIEIAI